MALEQERFYTEEEYEALENEGLIEYDNGHIIYMTPPSRVHSDISLDIASTIRTYLNGKPCKVYHAPFNVRLKLSSGIKRVEPDISIICDKSKLTSKGCEGAPDFIIEIVSPSNKMHDYATKFNWYREAGVKEYWIINPDNKTILVYIFSKDDVANYTFNDNVPISIFDNDLVIDFRNIDMT
ncbi:MAG: protein of unknown function DUF820 [uncultured bacterium]|nr:MAG: protein of unknown function DUF820 [uncultured bacterium]